MKPAALIVPLALLVFPVRASAQWVGTGHPPGGSVLCFTVQGDNLFAGTYLGGVFRSTDKGVTWRATSAGLSSLLVPSMASSEEYLFAGTGSPWLHVLGGAEGVFRSSDLGETWSPVNTGLPKGSVFALALNGPRLFAGTGFGVFLSTDSGNAWTEVNNGLTDTTVRALAVNATHVFAGTPSGLFASTDDGASWVLSSNGLPVAWVSALALNDTYLFAATADGGIFRSDDNGLSWTPVGSGLPGDLSTPALGVTGGTVIAGGDDGRIFRSSDSGESWLELTTELPHASIQAVTLMDSNIYAGTGGHGVYHSSDVGTTWCSAQPGLANTSVQDLAASGTTIVSTAWWTGTGFGEFLGVSRSTDGGVTWARTGEGLNSKITTLAVKGDTLYAGSSGGRIYGSTDQGVVWSALEVAYPDTSFRLIGVGEGDLYAEASLENGGMITSIALIRSRNGGITWNAIDTGLPSQFRVSAVLKRGNTLLAGSNSGIAEHPTLYRSTDDGATWDPVEISGERYFVEAFGTMENSLLVGTNGDGIFRSTDDGQTWYQASTGFPGVGTTVREFAAVGSSLFAASGTGVFVSGDEGASWTPANEGLTSSCISLTACGENLYAGTSCRGIWKRPLSEMTTTTRISPAAIPTRFHLHQNYPNPFNPATRIQYELPHAGFVTLRIYGVLGREVATLVAEEQVAGVFNLTWEADGLPSGVYFFRLTAGEYVRTRSMLLLR